MTDRIYVTYSQLVSSSSPFYHATVNYERTNASGNVIVHQTMDGGPSNRSLTLDEQQRAIIEECGITVTVH
jgi:hypothetical protein